MKKIKETGAEEKRKEEVKWKRRKEDRTKRNKMDRRIGQRKL